MISEDRIAELSQTIRIAAQESSDAAMTLAMQVVRNTPGITPALNAAIHDGIIGLKDDDHSGVVTAQGVLLRITDSDGFFDATYQAPADLTEAQAKEQIAHIVASIPRTSGKAASSTEARRLHGTLVAVGFVPARNVVTVPITL